MAKKETTAKKAETKKKAATKKPATKKQIKKVTKVTEEQLPKIAEELQEQTIIETVDLEKFKDEKGEYDLTNATEEEVKSAINQLEDDDKIFIVKNEKSLEVVNGDPSVIAPVEEVVPIEKEEPIEFDVVEEKVEKKVVEKKDEKKKITKRNNQSFGYFWNGQMIDF